MKYCPDCGKESLRLIEMTNPDGSDEYKEILTCDTCENMVHIFRQVIDLQEA